MLTQVRLLGKLGQKFGRVWNLAIRTPADAIRAIACNCPDFTQYLHESDERGVTYRVVIDNPEGIDESFLNFSIGNNQLIIAPIIRGAGGGFGKVLLGGALLVGSFFMPATVSLFGFGISSASIGLLGASLLLGGIQQMLSPTPKTPEPKSSERQDSFLFDRAQEVGNQGSPVPVGYGERIIVDPIILSSAIFTQEIPIG